MTQKNVSDSGEGHDSVSIEAFQSGMLVLFTRKLAELTKNFENKPECECLVTATILMGAAAIESLLLDVAYVTNPTKYKDSDYRNKGVRKKYEELTGNNLDNRFPNVSELWGHRVALSHSEPDLRRTRLIGQRINPEGAVWVADTVDEFAVSLWGDQMPVRFSSTTGLKPGM